MIWFEILVLKLFEARNVCFFYSLWLAAILSLSLSKSEAPLHPSASTVGHCPLLQEEQWVSDCPPYSSDCHPYSSQLLLTRSKQWQRLAAKPLRNHESLKPRLISVYYRILNIVSKRRFKLFTSLESSRNDYWIVMVYWRVRKTFIPLPPSS